MRFVSTFEFDLDEQEAREWFLSHQDSFCEKLHHFNPQYAEKIVCLHAARYCLDDLLEKHKIISVNVPNNTLFDIETQLYTWFTQWLDEESKSEEM